MTGGERTRATLLQAAFHQPPTFRMGFDAHVKAWRAHVQRETVNAYYKVGDFARAFDAERTRRDRMAREAIGWGPDVDPALLNTVKERMGL